MGVVVMGAGVAGLAAALRLAERGWSVDVYEARDEERAGAWWINGVAPATLEAWGLGDRLAELEVGHATAFVQVPPAGGGRVRLSPSPIVDIDMQALQRILAARLVEAGGRVHYGARCELIHRGDGIDPAQVMVATEGARGAAPVAAELVIDGRGLGRSFGPWIDPAADVCSAWQAVHPVVDQEACARWLTSVGGVEGETLSFLSPEGPWSIENVLVMKGGREVAILCGALNRPGYRSGARIARELIERLGFLGPATVSGGGLIPLLPQGVRLVEGRVVRVGNAPGFVFPVHGSGVEPALRLADLLAERVGVASAARRVNVGRLEALDGLWWRGHGGLCAAWHPLRAVVSVLGPAQVAAALEVGIVGEQSARRALEQLPVAPVPLDGRALLRHGRALGPVLPALASAMALSAALAVHHARCPLVHGEALDRWYERERQLLTQARRWSKADAHPPVRAGATAR
mgnify:CR=1 FL=1